MTDKLAKEKPAKKMKAIPEGQRMPDADQPDPDPGGQHGEGKVRAGHLRPFALSKPIPVLESVKDYVNFPAESAERKLLMTRLTRGRTRFSMPSGKSWS